MFRCGLVDGRAMSAGPRHLSDCFEQLLSWRSWSRSSNRNVKGRRRTAFRQRSPARSSRSFGGGARDAQEKGFAGASAREIASTGDFNQALIFYHFGSVRERAAGGARPRQRLAGWMPTGRRSRRPRTLPELAAWLGEIYAEDLENGYVTVLGEMVAGGVSDRRAGPRGGGAASQPWIEMVAGQAARASRRIAVRVDAPAARYRVRDRRAVPGRRHAQPPGQDGTRAPSRCSTSASALRAPARRARSSHSEAIASERRHRAGPRHGSVQLLGASHRRAAAGVGRAVRTLTFHPDRPHPLQGRVETLPLSVRRPGGSRREPRRRDHPLQHLLGPVRSRPNDVRQRDRELTSAVLRGQARRGGAGRSRQHRKPLARIAAALLPRQGFGRTRAGGGRRSVLDRPANLGLWRRSRCPGEQHRLDPEAHAGVRAPGQRRYPVQPVHVDDLARICVGQPPTSTATPSWTRPGPRRWPSRARQAVRRAVRSHGPRSCIVPPAAMSAASRALGLLVRDVVLTPDEISGLTAGLLVPRDAPRADRIQRLARRERRVRSATLTPTSFNATSLSRWGADDHQRFALVGMRHPAPVCRVPEP